MEIKEKFKRKFEERYPNITDNAKIFWFDEIEKAFEEGVSSIDGITDLEEEIIEKLAFKKKHPEELHVYVNPENGKKILKYRGVILATRTNSPAYENFTNYNLIDDWIDSGKSADAINAGLKKSLILTKTEKALTLISTTI